MSFFLTQKKVKQIAVALTLSLLMLGSAIPLPIISNLIVQPQAAQAVTTTQQYTADGSTKDYAIVVPILKSGDLVVTDNGSTKTIITHYTINKLLDTVSFVTAPTNGHTILFTRKSDLTDASFLPSLGTSQDYANDILRLSYLLQEQGTIGTAASHATGDFLQTANNLSDVTAATARTNLGLGTAATQTTGTFLQTANNLSEVTAATARTNLGLGTAATHVLGDFLLTSQFEGGLGVAGLDAASHLVQAEIPLHVVGSNGGGVTLTDAATIAVDASLGNTFRVTLGGNRTLGNATNGVDGQVITIQIKQDATGTRTLAYDTQYTFSTTFASPTLTTTVAHYDILKFMWDGANSKWRCIGISLNYAT